MKGNIFGPVVAVLLFVWAVTPIHADEPHQRGIMLDGTIGISGKADLPGPNYEIRAEHGQQAGPNLFHSFQQFNIHSGESATFRGPDSVQRIVSRVTGGSSSWIDGRLASEIPGADLYLLNPAGLMFGPNATLDLGGSFHGNTADYLRMGENERFYTMPQKNGPLSVTEPAAFGFLDDDIAPITFEGRGKITEREWTENSAGFNVSEGKSISLIGGDIEIKKGTFFEVVRLVDPEGNFLPVHPDGIPKYADDEGNPVFFDPNGNPISSDDVLVDELVPETRRVYPRDILAPAGQIHMASVASPGEVIPEEKELDTSSFEKMGNLTLSEKAYIGVNEDEEKGEKAGSVLIRCGQFVMDDSGIQAETYMSKESGAVDIQAETLSLNASHISVSTRGDGESGDISIVASESVRLYGNDDNGEGSAFVAYTHDGDAGNISLKTRQLSLNDGAEITTASDGPGKSGDIILDVSESVSLSGNGSEGTPIMISASSLDTSHNAGDAGNIRITSEKLSLNDGAQIASASYGRGKGGDIRIIASESAHFSGSRHEGSGSGVVTSTFSPLPGADKAGDIDIVTKNLSLNHGAWIGSYTEGSGSAGNIHISASESLTLSGFDDKGNPSIISVGSVSEDDDAGDAGKISIATKKLAISDRAAISTRAENAGGGEIEIHADEFIRVSGGGVTSSVKKGEENAGNIEILGPEFVTLNHGRIIANAHGGDGGDIHIAAAHFIQSSDSEVSASSQLGIDGVIDIESPETDISSGFTVLPSVFLPDIRLNDCSDRFGQDVVRFVIAPRDAVPTSPDDWLASPPPSFGEMEEARPLLLNGEEYYHKGDFEAAVQVWEQALPSLNAESLSHLHALAYLTHAYQALGHHDKALSVLNKAFPFFGKSEDYAGALFFSTLGDLHFSLGNRTQAEAYLEKGEKAARASGNSRVLAGALNNMANFLAADRFYQDAADKYRECLDIEASPFLRSKALINMLRAKILNRYDENVLTELNHALGEIGRLPDCHDKASDLLSLSILARSFHRKKTGNRVRNIAYEALDKAGRIAEKLRDTRVASHAYGHMGKLYENDRRHSEAVTLTRHAIFLAQQTYSPEILYLWQRQLGRLFRIEDDIEKAVKAYERAISTLRPVSQDPETPCPPGIILEFFRGYRDRRDAFYEQIRPVYLELADMLLKQTKQTSEVLETSEVFELMEHLKAVELQNFYQDECVTARQKDITELRRTPPGTAMIYPIVLKNRLALLLILPDGMKLVNVPIDSPRVNRWAEKFNVSDDSEKLREWAERFREQLQKYSSRFRVYAKALYDWLIAPVESELADREIDTLIVAPDGPLRLIPFSALHDGESFLIEKYAIVTVPAINLTDPKKADLGNARILLGGLSEEAVPRLPGWQRSWRRSARSWGPDRSCRTRHSQRIIWRRNLPPMNMA